MLHPAPVIAIPPSQPKAPPRLTAAARAVGLAVPDRISTFGLLVLGTPPKFTISARSNLHWRLAVFALEGVINLTLAFARIQAISSHKLVGILLLWKDVPELLAGA